MSSRERLNDDDEHGSTMTSGGSDLGLASLSIRDENAGSKAAAKKPATSRPAAGLARGRSWGQSPSRGLGGRIGKDVVAKDSDWKDLQASPKKGGTKKPGSKVFGDRYIPRREDTESNPPTLDLTSQSVASATDAQHTAELSSAMGIDLNRRILTFASEPPPTSKDTSSALLAAYARHGRPAGAPSASGSAGLGAASGTSRRRVATTPERVLDAPGLADDYYLNLVDWSCGNLVAIALEASVYIWNAETSEVSCLCSLAEDGQESEEYICSIRFSGDGSYLALGNSSGSVQIYDLETGALIRTMAGHQSRIPTVDWFGATLSSGARDGSIWNHDVRSREHKIGEMVGHRGEVCGLRWRPEQADSVTAGALGLLASGGNDNVVNVWDGRMLNAPKMTKTNHTAAVKALAWSPWQSSLLASGGGSSDKMVHLWNVSTGSRLNSLQTPSQVTSVIFNPHSREFLTSHGFPDMNLSIYDYPSLRKVVDIPQAHDSRVLHSALSPDGTVVATASNDENLKFWRVFEGRRAKGAGSGGAFGAAKMDKENDEEGVGRKARGGMSIR